MPDPAYYNARGRLKVALFFRWEMLLSIVFLLKWLQSFVLAFNDHFHAFKGILFLQKVEVVVEQTDTALAVASGHGFLVVSAAMDTNTRKTWCFQAHEPVAV